MAEPDDLDPDRYVVVFLRRRTNMMQAEFGEASRVNQSDLSKYERGKLAVPEDALRRMAEVAALDWSLVGSLRRFFSAVLAAAARAPVFRGAEALDLEVLEPALLAAAPYLIEDQTAEPRGPTPEETQREAEEIWTALERFDIPRRRRLIELAFQTSLHASWSSALAARVREASERAAAHDAQEAQELADLAGFISGLAKEQSGEPDLLHVPQSGDAHLR